MEHITITNFIKNILNHMPKAWLELTTHRLDIYNESLAKTEFTTQLETLYSTGDVSDRSLNHLPTAYDYIRLGHPLSCVLEWVVAKYNNLSYQNVIAFQSKTTPILAILRKNLFDNTKTRLVYNHDLPKHFDSEIINNVYGYNVSEEKITDINTVKHFNGTTIYVGNFEDVQLLKLPKHIDFHLNTLGEYGSILTVNTTKSNDYISEIQHVRRRETVAMTPGNTLVVLQHISNLEALKHQSHEQAPKAKTITEQQLSNITHTKATPLVATSGLSIQYAIMMGLIDNAQKYYPGKAIKFIVPPNCYGGTNDQARRVAACIDHVDIIDLHVDVDNNMVHSIETILNTIADQDAVPFIIAEIPTNPRVEVPNMDGLKKVLSKGRKTPNGDIATAPVFILDQTFCPNVNVLGANQTLANVKAILYASGSKFPSGGLCTAGYCVANSKAEYLLPSIKLHLDICDNEATNYQYEILAKQLPSMLTRIDLAYKNTRDFVNFISETLPEAKINFVSEALAKQGFTPSVFSLDLPTKGNTEAEKEAYKRKLNHQLIQLMITEIPTESKYCVSYGQFKGCYWTIPATSTQGTTKEDDKDYIARVALSPNMDLEQHKAVFKTFVDSIN